MSDLYTIEKDTLTASADKVRGYVNNDSYNTEGISPTELPDAIEEVYTTGYNLGKSDGILSSPVKSVNSKTGDVVLNAEDVGARPSTWTPSYSDVGADPSGTASSEVSKHDVSKVSHNDIRLLITTLSNRLDTVLDSDDTTLDELSEIVTYIKSNKSLIDAITTSKVNVTDIVDDFSTNVVDKPLSAARGVALKALVDALDTGKLNKSELPTAIETALAQAKASGKFDGEKGDKGDTYVLTDDDKADIAELILSLIPYAESTEF